MTATSATNTAKADGNVRVVVRIRPLSQTEQKRGCTEAISSMNQDFGGSSSNGEPDLLEVRQHDKRWFEFDAVIGDQSNQEDVYNKSGAHVCVSEDLFSGYNATIFCYGQTGAGATIATVTTLQNESGHPPSPQ